MAGADGDGFRERVAALTGSTVADAEQLDGGAVGEVHRIALADGRTLVAKTGAVPLTVEARMLRFLATRTDLPVPGVVAATDDLLVLDHVAGDGPITPAVEGHLADLLAELHDRGPAADAAGPDDAFGFHFDTLSGALRQPNPWTGSWIEFVRGSRIESLADRAAEAGALPGTLRERVDGLAADLDALLVEPSDPDLVHGDCWTGNLVVDGDAVAAVLDPALYYGHAEVDLAYALWTDTVGDPFLDRYRERRGIRAGFETRRRVYEVVPLLEHVWHFGDEYVDPTRERLSELGY